MAAFVGKSGAVWDIPSSDRALQTLVFEEHQSFTGLMKEHMIQGPYPPAVIYGVALALGEALKNCYLPSPALQQREVAHCIELIKGMMELNNGTD